MGKEGSKRDAEPIRFGDLGPLMKDIKIELFNFIQNPIAAFPREAELPPQSARDALRQGAALMKELAKAPQGGGES